jgi:hypothetical protein
MCSGDANLKHIVAELRGTVAWPTLHWPRCNSVPLPEGLCQWASKFDPLSASNFDPLERRVRMVALAPLELVGVSETGAAWRIIVDSTFETSALDAGLDDVTVMGQPIE